MKIHDSNYWNARIAKIFATREAELTKKLNNIKQRRKDGWGYRRVYIEEYQVRKHTRGGYYANVPVKNK